MASNNGIGSQKEARRERVRKEIFSFVSQQPGCSAQAIVSHLTNDRGMRNHGLTPRKVGFFIPRYCTGITWFQDHAAGRRVYTPIGSPLAKRQEEKIHKYAKMRTGTHTPKPMTGLTGLASRACVARREMEKSASARKVNSASTINRATSMARSSSRTSAMAGSKN